MKIKRPERPVNYVIYAIFLIIPIIFIALYWYYRCHNRPYKDPLEISIISDLDGWSITHIIFFMILGYNFPNTFILSIIIGILWELCEYTLGKNRIPLLEECYNLSTDKQDGNWWYAKWSDVLLNIIGFLIGKAIHKYQTK